MDWLYRAFLPSSTSFISVSYFNQRKVFIIEQNINETPFDDVLCQKKKQNNNLPEVITVSVVLALWIAAAEFDSELFSVHFSRLTILAAGFEFHY